METPDKKHTARQALLTAARELFIEKGYGAVSTRELAEAAGVNLGAIQYHFGSKAKLFAETVRTIMQNDECNHPREILIPALQSREDAGARLCQFIAAFLDKLLRPCGPQPCKMMLRELFTPTSEDQEMFEAMIGAVVNDFIRPNDELLSSVVRTIAPQLDESEIHFSVASIIGQCFFYLSHAPFIERLHGIDCSKPPHFDTAAMHICKFSLRALGCDERFIEQSVRGIGGVKVSGGSN